MNKIIYNRELDGNFIDEIPKEIGSLTLLKKL